MPRKKTPEFESNGKALCYLRVSTGQQAISGLGLMSQGDICAEKAKQLGLTFRDISNDYAKPMRDGHFVDAGQSAFKTRFENRAAGGALMDWIEAGDTLIVARLDRAWRSVSDFIDISNKITARGVRLVVCSPMIDLGTASGRMLARQLANLAEWESDRKGERIVDALKAKKARNATSTANSTQLMENLPSDWRPTEITHPQPSGNQSPGRIFIYIRCSHRDSAASGLGMLVQADGARTFAKQLTTRNPNLRLEEVFTDAAVSASTINLRDRPAGKRLDEELKAGDAVVFSTLDRGFRNIPDMSATLLDWEHRGIVAHFASEGLSMDDPQGRSMAEVLVWFAQNEARLASDRATEARAQNAIQGKFCGGKDPVFWKVYKFASGKKLVIDKKQIVAYRLVSWLVHCCGMRIDHACARCEVLFAKRENRPAIPASGVHRNSKIWSQLPDDYPCDKFNRAFPYFGRQDYEKARPKYADAIAAWRKQAAILRGRQDAA